MMELHGLSSVSAIVPGCERIKVKKNVRALFAAAGLWLAFSMTANCRAGTLTEFEIKLPVFVPAPIKALSEHDVVLFVDRSASMAKPAGDPTAAESRWEWCSEQLKQFAKDSAQLMQQSMSLVLFSEGYKEFDNVGADDVRKIFTDNQPHGKTNTAIALDSELEKYFERKRGAVSEIKPLAIAIITDGGCESPGALRRVILKAAKKIDSPNELSITFLQIGHDEEGTKLLKEFDNDLMSRGAKFDIVQRLPFDELKRVGLMRGLAEAISPPHAAML